MQKHFKFLAAITFGGLAMGASLAMADDTKPPSPSVVSSEAEKDTTDKADPNAVVCRKQAPPTGTRLGGKTICLTNHDWQTLWQETRKGLQEMQNRPLVPKGPGS